MSFVEHSIIWARGEIVEGNIIAIVGILSILVALLCWKLGGTPGVRAMFIPILIYGLVLTQSGVSSHMKNNALIDHYKEIYESPSVEFIHNEKDRVESYTTLFKAVMIGALISFLLAVALFWFSLNPHVRAVAIMLSLFGTSALTIDFFAKERADVYYSAIQAELADPVK